MIGILKFFAVMLLVIKGGLYMEKTLYIDNTKLSVEVSDFDWHQSQNEIQCILIFLSIADKKRFIMELEEEFYSLQLDDMFLSQHWYNDIKDTQAIVFGAYYSNPPTTIDSFSEQAQSLHEEFVFNPDEVIF